ncbi:MAG: 23S rRNA (pseudouridine(1915)-N(3))-methyltransferase RlmH [Chitinophagaceae bacterium]|nr:23S rRNA (pseudouridine(1915)-N(3))-methyltransferase RlmH [Chitinophagaceae bacterium]
MKFLFCSIGKPDTADIQPAIKDFTQRISYYYPVEWKILPTIKNADGLSVHERKQKEAGLILSCVEKNDFLVLLYEKGKLISSEQLAGLIENKKNISIKRMVFCIGGVYGVDDTVFTRADYTWSLSPLTFPHQIVRLMLAEQVYRACTIIRNEKYHHA